jgi:predicted alpha/beta superfamily hydrolase
MSQGYGGYKTHIKNISKIWSIAIFICFNWASSISAQDIDTRSPSVKEIFPFGIVERIQSVVLEEERVLNIYLPQGYHPDSSQLYPTLYVLDGSAHEDFPHIAGLAQFMNMYDLMPKSIVVGIANVDRYRDFSHPSKDSLDLKSLPTSGGSALFMEFLAEELQPFISSRYKTNGHNTIIGQSMGGLLATEILFKQPDLFNDYIIVSPSLWWDRQSMINDAENYISNIPNKKRMIYLSLGQEHPVMHEVADLLYTSLSDADLSETSLFYYPILDEDHATILHSAVYKAMKTFYPKAAKKE